ncbi:hypothetical protein FisN_20Hh022 [Fistulifera solaris]|uniref:Uncharacterized protein n=1 Tax=Fistulifera solaris TaxID=1519565 RepID=A0A1Z5KBZ6_FISSO|nr:hypothetical protein FisN_20Hh022 [Fistulifera solaris]|eukprot:GAX23820.1 hypothetical protein FisN_20Hh022 [Fistulifera solaris]
MTDANGLSSSRIRMTDDTPSGARHVVGVYHEDDDANHNSLVDIESFSSSGSSSRSDDSTNSSSSSVSSSSDDSSTPGGSSVEDEDGWDTGAESTDDDDDDNDTAGAIATISSLGPSSTASSLSSSFPPAPTMEEVQHAFIEPQPFTGRHQLSEREKYMEEEYDARHQQYIEEHGSIDPYQEQFMEQRLLNDMYYQQRQTVQPEQYTPLDHETFKDEEDPLMTPWKSPTKSNNTDTMQDTYEDEFHFDKDDWRKSRMLIVLPRIIACTCIAIVVLIIVLIFLIRNQNTSSPLPVTQPVNRTAAPVTPIPETVSPSVALTSVPSVIPSMAPSMIPSDVPTIVPTLAPIADPWTTEIENLETDDSVSFETFQYQVDSSMDGSTMVVLSLDQSQSIESVQVYHLEGNVWQDVAFTASEAARRRLLSAMLKQSTIVLSNSGRELMVSNPNGTSVHRLSTQNVWIPKGQTLNSSGTMSGDGNSLVAESLFYTWDGSVWVEDPIRALPLQSFEKLSLSSDGSVVAALLTGSLHALRWDNTAAQWVEKIVSPAAMDFALSSDGTTIVEAGSKSATVFRFKNDDWAVDGSLVSETFSEVAISADGLTLAGAVESGWAQVYDYDTASMEWIETAPAKVVAPSGSGISGISLSGNGRKLSLGVVPRFETGTSYIFTLSREAEGPTAAPTAAPSFFVETGCNGLVSLCEAKANEVMYAIANKSQTAIASDYTVALNAGVRGFEWEITADADITTPIGAAIFDFVYTHPKEVLVLQLHLGQVDLLTAETLLTGITHNATLEIFGEYFYKHSITATSWPTLAEMAETKRRIIAFVNSSSSEFFNDWNQYVTEHVNPTTCDNQSATDFDAIYLNTNTSDNAISSLNNLSDLDMYVTGCEKPNFVVFNHFGSNEAASVVDSVLRYNSQFVQTSLGPTSLSPSLAPSLSPHPTNSFAPSDVPTIVPTAKPSISASPTFGPTLTLQPSMTAGPTTSSFLPTSSFYPTGTSFPTGTSYPTGSVFPTYTSASSATSLPAALPVATVLPTASQTTSGTNIFNRPPV